MTHVLAGGALFALLLAVVLSACIRAERHSEAVILALLSDGAYWYGLDLVKASGGLLRRGTVYVYLGRLQDQRLVVSREDAEPLPYVGLKRQRYGLTNAGRRAVS